MNVKRDLINRMFLIAAFLVIFILEGCGGPTPPPEVSSQLAMKAKSFMDVAALLFAQGPDFWGQGLRNIYYSALTLARLKSINSFYASRDKFHSKVWSISPLPIRNYFDKDFKKVRSRHDYDPAAGKSVATSDFADFLQKGVTPFKNLLVQANKNIEDDYYRCTDTPSTCTYCREANVAECLKRSGKTELEAIHITLQEIVTKNSR